MSFKVIYAQIQQICSMVRQRNEAFFEKKKKKKRGEFQCNPFNLFHSGMGGVVVIIPIQVIKTSLCMCQRTAVFLFFLPPHRVSKASAHYKPISLYQLIFTFDSVAVLMGVGTRVSVHRNLNNVMKPGADLIYNPMPWLNSIMSFPPPPFICGEIREK